LVLLAALEAADIVVVLVLQVSLFLVEENLAQLASENSAVVQVVRTAVTGAEKELESSAVDWPLAAASRPVEV
jgi:hypothetical protein